MITEHLFPLTFRRHYVDHGDGRHGQPDSRQRAAVQPAIVGQFGFRQISRSCARNVSHSSKLHRDYPVICPRRYNIISLFQKPFGSPTVRVFRITSQLLTLPLCEKPSIMDRLLVFTLIFLSSLSSALSHGPRCSPVSFNITAGAANIFFQNLPDTNDSNATMQFLASSFDASRGQPDTRYINTTVAIQALHCRPQFQSQNSKKLQLLVHGITYDKSMWSGFGYSPRHDWQAYATSLGYHTLAVDRLGHGSMAPHPDPFAVVQGPLQVDILHKLIGMLRQGWLELGGFEEIIYVGHSYGSSLGNMLAKEHPLDADALILTGFSGALSTTSSTLFLSKCHRSKQQVQGDVCGISHRCERER